MRGLRGLLDGYAMDVDLLCERHEQIVLRGQVRGASFPTLFVWCRYGSGS